MKVRVYLAGLADYEAGFCTSRLWGRR